MSKRKILTLVIPTVIGALSSIIAQAMGYHPDSWQYWSVFVLSYGAFIVGRLFEVFS